MTPCPAIYTRDVKTRRGGFFADHALRPHGECHREAFAEAAQPSGEIGRNDWKKPRLPSQEKRLWRLHARFVQPVPR